MTFPEVFKAFLEVGMLGLCAIMMCIIFYENHKRSQQTDDEKNKLIVENYNKIEAMLTSLTKNIQEQNNALLERQEQHFLMENQRTSELIKAIITGVTQHVPSAEEDKKLDEINTEVDKTLRMLREDTNADRACIVQYHNGGKGINRQSFQKMSMTNEQVKLSIQPMMGEFKDQYRMSLSYFVNKLRDDGKCYIKSVEDIKDLDASTYEFMKFKEINSLYGKAIKGPEGNVIAFVGLEYTGKNMPNDDLIDEALDKYHIIFEGTLNK